MKYIKAMEIYNFQSHRDTKISFENGLNVISGPSDNGKSAIIRALKWVLYNEPKGTDFITQGESCCRVSITLSDDTVITRERSGSKNIYRLKDSSGVESIFEGFGTDIPPEILNAHGIIRLHIDSSSSQCINIADQLEAPFLISQPGSIKAKAIGKLVGVDIIDEAIKELNKEITLHQSQERSTQQELDNITNQLKAYEGLPRLKDYLEIKEKKIQIIKDKSQKYSRLEKLADRLNALNADIRTNCRIIETMKHLDCAEHKLLNLQKIYNKIERVNYYALQYSFTEKDMACQNNILNETRNVDVCMYKAAKCNEKCMRLNQLIICMKKYDNIHMESERLTRYIERLNILDKVQFSLLRLTEHTKILESLSSIKASFDGVNSSIRKGISYTARFNKVEEADKELITLEAMKAKYNELLKIKELYNQLVKEILSIQNDKCKYEGIIKQELDQYTRVLKKIGRCPVCFSPIDEHKVEDIVKEFKGEDI